MKEVIVIPTFARPELLALALERIRLSTDPPRQVYIFPDDPTEQTQFDLEYVRDTYLPSAVLFKPQPHPKTPSGCWNILNSLKQGYESGSDWVYLIEEDVLIGENFFQWHRLHQIPTIRHRNDPPHIPLVTCGRLDKRFHSRWPGAYTNPGSCLSRRLLARVIPHINQDYFLGLRSYLNQHLMVADEHSELDDGLIRRVIWQMRSEGEQGRVNFADPQVCWHVGFHFYNKVDRYLNRDPRIQTRIERARELLQTTSPTDRYAGDYEKPGLVGWLDTQS